MRQIQLQSRRNNLSTAARRSQDGTVRTERIRTDSRPTPVGHDACRIPRSVSPYCRPLKRRFTLCFKHTDQFADNCIKLAMELNDFPVRIVPVQDGQDCSDIVIRDIGQQAHTAIPMRAQPFSRLSQAYPFLCVMYRSVYMFLTSDNMRRNVYS
jgi:hypothetical protein